MKLLQFIAMAVTVVGRSHWPVVLVLFLFHSISISISVDYHIKFYGNLIKQWCILCPSENEWMPFMRKFSTCWWWMYANIFSVNYHVHAFINKTKQQACLKQNTPAQIHSTSCQFELFMIEQISNFNIVVVHFDRIIDSMPHERILCMDKTMLAGYILNGTIIAVNSTLLLLQAHNRLIKHSVWEVCMCVRVSEWVSEWIVCVHVLDSLWLLINLLLFIAHDPTQANY